MEKHTIQCFRRVTYHIFTWCVGAYECDCTSFLSRPGMSKNMGVRHGQMIPEVTPMDF